jgi:hypothetical protein
LTKRDPALTTRRTKPALALLWLILAASAVRSEDVGPPPPPPARTLQVKEPSFDAGKVDQGAKLRHVFQLRNTGKVPLSIDAKPG